MKRWDDLRLFLAVARSGTLSSAAGELDLSISTVQRRVAALEADLGTVLFQKGPRGYQLTHAGEALFPQTCDVEEAILGAARAVVGHDQKASGDVRITTPHGMLPLLAQHLSAFSDVCPGVRPILLTDDVVLDLGRSTDIALRATTQPVESAVGRDICGVGWGRYASITTEGEDLPWIHYLGMNSHPAIQWRKQAFPSSKALMLACGVVSMHALLVSSNAQGLLPCFLGDVDPRLRRIGEPVAENRLWLLIHADLRRSARVRALIDFLIPRLKASAPLFEGKGGVGAADGVSVADEHPSPRL